MVIHHKYTVLCFTSIVSGDNDFIPFCRVGVHQVILSGTTVLPEVGGVAGCGVQGKGFGGEYGICTVPDIHYGTPVMFYAYKCQVVGFDHIRCIGSIYQDVINPRFAEIHGFRKGVVDDHSTFKSFFHDHLLGHERRSVNREGNRYTFRGIDVPVPGILYGYYNVFCIFHVAACKRVRDLLNTNIGSSQHNSCFIIGHTTINLAYGNRVKAYARLGNSKGLITTAILPFVGGKTGASIQGMLKTIDHLVRVSQIHDGSLENTHRGGDGIISSLHIIYIIHKNREIVPVACYYSLSIGEGKIDAVTRKKIRG